VINSKVQDQPTTVIRDQQISFADTRPLPAVPAPARDGIVRYWRFVAVVVAACVAATAGYVSLVPPAWEASAHILVTPAPTDTDVPGLGLVSGTADPARYVQTAIALLDTSAADAATAAKMGAPWSPASVASSVVLQPLGESYVVEVKAQADSSSTAAKLATTYAENALATRNSEIEQRATALLTLHAGLPSGVRNALDSALGPRLQLIARVGDPSLSMAQPAVAPSSPVGLPAQYKLALSAVLGLCLAIAGVWARTRGTRPAGGMRVPAPGSDDNGWDK
jgi:hypothetical protein